MKFHLRRKLRSYLMMTVTELYIDMTLTLSTGQLLQDLSKYKFHIHVLNINM